MAIRRERRVTDRLKRDGEATLAADFACKRSWIHLDGSQHLKGADMSARREHVFQRDHYRCVKCGSRLSLEADHIKSRGQGGDDSMENLQTLCRACHKIKHNREVRWTPRAEVA